MYVTDNVNCLLYKHMLNVGFLDILRTLLFSVISRRVDDVTICQLSGSGRGSCRASSEPVGETVYL